MKKNIALFLNHHIIGGAERSGIELAEKMSSKANVDIFYPFYDQETFMKFKKDLPKGLGLITYNMPSAFSNLSRGKRTRIIFTLVFSIYSILLSFRLKVGKYDVLWMNGTRAFALLTPALLLKEKGRILFHLRDYVPNNRVLSLILKSYLFMKKEILVVGNSDSIRNDFLKEYGHVSNLKSTVLYNYCSKVEKKHRENIEVISIPSMLTPWKGQHSIILFAQLYGERLQTLGIKKLLFYGDNIYLGDDGKSYRSDIEKLSESIGVEIVEFAGVKEKKEVFRNSDLIIHSTLRREPFGRILLEGFGSGIPVISTGLGGSFEVMTKTNMIYSPYHHEELYLLIKKISESREVREALIQEQYAAFEDFKRLTEKQVREVFNLEDLYVF